MAALQSLGIEVKIWHDAGRSPQSRSRSIATPQHASYDREYVTRFWRILLAADSVFREFRSGFIGKNSPVHFFWGSFDLAVTRFPDGGHRSAQGADLDHS